MIRGLIGGSNTKVKRFIMYADGVAPFREVAESTAAPNAYTKLKEMDQDETCQIADAADLCLMLADGLSKRSDVERVTGSAKSASWSLVSIDFVFPRFAAS